MLRSHALSPVAAAGFLSGGACDLAALPRRFSASVPSRTSQCAVQTQGMASQIKKKGVVTTRAAAGEAASDADPIPLLTPYKGGPFDLSMRIVYAPLTRCRALGHIPQPAAALYYSQRAHKGQFLLTEATVVRQDGIGYLNVPGVFSEEQVEAWKPIVQAVKAKGATFFMQLWHSGRAAHYDYWDGVTPPIAPSAIPLKDENLIYTPKGVRTPLVPREMTKEDIAEVVEAFRVGARNAMRAGFDGVEIHGANGYLIDEFLKDGCNKRTDEYGGPIENRARFPLEVINACAEEVGEERVGIRLSPYEGYLDSSDTDPLTTNMYLVDQLNATRPKMAYLHFVEARASVMGDGTNQGKSLDPFRKAWKGTFIAAGGYTRETGNAAISSGHADLIAFGRLALANPDLPERYAANAPLNKYDRDSFYSPDQVKGYTDYPFLTEVAAVSS